MISTRTPPPGARRYTITPTPTVTAIQLTADADWKAVAEWCDGVLAGRSILPGHEVIELHVPGGDTAETDDWVIRGATGKFFVRDPASFASCYQPYGFDLQADSQGWRRRLEDAINAEVILSPGDVRLVVDGIMSELREDLDQLVLAREGNNP
jgi:hypothetical protein